MLSDATLVAIVASVPPTLMALAALISSIRNGRKQDVTVAKVTAQAEVIATLEKNTNSIKDALVAATDAAARAQGHEAGRIAGKAEEKQDQA